MPCKVTYDSTDASVVARPLDDDDDEDDDGEEFEADFGGPPDDEDDDKQLEPAVAARSDITPTPKYKAIPPSTPPQQKSIGAARLRSRPRSRGRAEIRLVEAPWQVRRSRGVPPTSMRMRSTLAINLQEGKAQPQHSAKCKTL